MRNASILFPVLVPLDLVFVIFLIVIIPSGLIKNISIAEYRYLSRNIWNHVMYMEYISKCINVYIFNGILFTALRRISDRIFANMDL